MSQLLWALPVSFLVALVLTPLFRWLALRLKFFYTPTATSVNRQPIPLLGGMAIFLAFVLPILIANNLTREMIGILLASVLLLILGLVDDYRKISSRLQLLGIFIAAGVAVIFGVRIQFFSNPFGNNMLLLEAAAIPVTMLWIAGFTSSIKVMDGLDGLAAGICAISALTLAAVSWENGLLDFGSPTMVLAMLSLAGACLGFLPYNFHPAKIFMGEAGIIFLGFVLSCISVEGLLKRSFLVAISIPILSIGLPLFNTLFAIVRRRLKGKDILGADQEHIHDLLLYRGISHRKVVLLLYAVSAALGVLAFFMARVDALVALLIWVALIVILFWGAWRIGLIGRRS
jgi:UDP-GlcNAc:undecaprenyl-phosphate GlcNAc-1-phosphate transferase